MLYSYNKFHQAQFLSSANEITGQINLRYNKVEDFFSLREENKRVHAVNDSLLNISLTNFSSVDTTQRIVKDTLLNDTVNRVRRYLFRPAMVVYNSTSGQKNYLQIDRGFNQGIRENMAVLNSDGSAVGIVVGVSPNFSQVMSLLHVQQKVNVSMKKSGDFGTLEWDGYDPSRLILKGMPKSVPIHQGDTVVSSRYSFNFPPGYPVGTIAGVVNDKTTNFYTLLVKPTANFNNLQQVFVVENLQYSEQEALDKETRKRIEDPKRRNK
jgi:rod shape-determining protein MreC